MNSTLKICKAKSGSIQLSRLNGPAFISQLFHSHMHTLSTGSGCSKFKQDMQARYQKGRKGWEERKLSRAPLSHRAAVVTMSAMICLLRSKQDWCGALQFALHTLMLSRVRQEV